MSTSTSRNWWVVLTAALAVVVIAGGMLAVGLAATGDDGAFAVVGGFRLLVAGPLMLYGLRRLADDRTTGSTLVLVGAVLAASGSLELIPYGAAVLISGFWTGNLQLADRSDAPELQPVSRQQFEMTRRWYLWLVAAAVLFGIGWIPLVVEGGDLTWGYFIWVLSWLGAIVAAGVGVVQASLRLVVRHRTRFA